MQNVSSMKERFAKVGMEEFEWPEQSSSRKEKDTQLAPTVNKRETKWHIVYVDRIIIISEKHRIK